MTEDRRAVLRPAVAAFIAAAATVLVYSTSLPGTFQFDDIPTIVDNAAVRDPALLARYFTQPSLFSSIPGNGMYRPVLLVTYLLDHLLAGYSPFVWHLTNVLFHALNAALVVLLASRLPGRLGGSGAFPLLAGLAFGLHPVHSEVVNYVSSRSEAVAAAGFLGALLCHLGARREGASPARKAALTMAAVALYLAGLGAKELVIALVLVVPALEWLDPPESRRLSRMVGRALPFVLATVAYLLVRSAVRQSALGSIAWRVLHQSPGGDVLSGGGRTPWQNLMTQSRVFWHYVWLVLVPVRLALDRFVRVSTSFSEPAVLVSTAGIVALFGAAFLGRRRFPLGAFAAAIVLFGLAPTSSFLPLNILMNEHRLYLPGTGIALLMGAAGAWLIGRWPRAGVALLAGVGVGWAGLAAARSLEWQDARRLWEANVRVSPRSYRAHNQLGSVAYDEAAALGSVPAALPHLDEAISWYERAVEIYPDWYDPHLNLGIAFREKARLTGAEADWDRSIAEFERCREIIPDGWRSRYQLATTFGVRKAYDEAIRMFSEMAEEDRSAEGRRLPIYLFPMASLELERGRYAAAADLYREIRGSSPDDPSARGGLALALAKSGEREKADALYRELLDARPREAGPCLEYARFLLSLDPPDRKGASALFRRAIGLGYRPSPADFELFQK